MNLLQLLIGAVAIVGMFLILVGPHEFGHFAFAKLFKVGVYEFSLGLGTRLWSTVRSIPGDRSWRWLVGFWRHPGSRVSLH